MLIKPRAKTAAAGRDRYHRERVVATIRAREIFNKFAEVYQSKSVLIVYDANHHIFCQFKKLLLKSDLTEFARNPWGNQFTFTSIFDTDRNVYIGVKEVLVENALLIFVENPVTFFRMLNLSHVKEDISRIYVKYYPYTYLIAYSYLLAHKLLKHTRKYHNCTPLNIFLYDPLEKIRYEFLNGVKEDRILKSYHEELTNLRMAEFLGSVEKGTFYCHYTIKKNRIFFIEGLEDYLAIMYSRKFYIESQFKVDPEAQIDFLY